jgi:hypothetical protein
VFMIQCSDCKEKISFIDYGGTWASDLSFKWINDLITLECKCGNKIRIR